MEAIQGCRLLIERAHDQRQALNAEIRAFLGSQPYEVVSDREPDTGEGLLRLKVLREPPPVWSVIVGEIIHDVRSALDHLVWGLTEIEQGVAPDPLPRGSDWRRTEFPIFDDPAAYLEGTKNGLWGLTAADRTLIESLQPYHGGNELRLWYLHELSNISKHRRLHLTCAMLERRERYIRAIRAEDARVQQIEFNADPRIHDGALVRHTPAVVDFPQVIITGACA